MKKYLKAYLIAMGLYWVYVGTGAYMGNVWNAREYLETSDDPELEALRGKPVTATVTCIKCAQEATFKIATNGWKKEIKALTGKWPWEE